MALLPDDAGEVLRLGESRVTTLFQAAVRSLDAEMPASMNMETHGGKTLAAAAEAAVAEAEHARRFGRRDAAAARARAEEMARPAVKVESAESKLVGEGRE